MATIRRWCSQGAPHTRPHRARNRPHPRRWRGWPRARSRLAERDRPAHMGEQPTGRGQGAPI